MKKIVIYDFEVFRFDVLLGLLIVDGGKKRLFQTWDKEKMKDIYRRTKGTDWTWVGFNNTSYDDHIYEAILEGKDPYETSKAIIQENWRRSRFDIRSFDVMRSTNKFVSLKVTELIRGERIDTSDVDFDLPRPLTEEEKKATERYNESDLEATLYNFSMFYNKFALKLDLIEEFGLDAKKALRATDAQLSAMVLGAKKIEGIESMEVTRPEYRNLRLKNEPLLRFYESEGWRSKVQKTIRIGNAELTVGSGGLHQAIPRCHYDKLLYCDVSGYYNLVMMNYNLLPRSVPPEGKARYRDMYRQQLEMKKSNPIKRAGYKTVLLAVFGAQLNEYSDFYDPQQGYLVTITGQLFLCDLLEKLAPYVTIVQTNTDGVMLSLNNWDSERYIIGMIEDWERRTGFVIKKEKIYDLWQRDVNNYVYRAADGSIECKGEALRNWKIDDEAYSKMTLFDATNPPIVARGVIEYLMNQKSPESVVEAMKGDLRYFQYSCKKGAYDALLLDGEEIRSPSRAFAAKKGSIEIQKAKDGRKARVPNLPSPLLVWNGNIQDLDSERINYGYYVSRIKERIDEFVGPVQMTLW